MGGKGLTGQERKNIHTWAGLVLWRKYCKDVSDELNESKDEMRRSEGG